MNPAPPVINIMAASLREPGRDRHAVRSFRAWTPVSDYHLSMVFQPEVDPLPGLRDELLRWLLRDALPLWERHGIDWSSGGYFENITFDPGTERFAAAGDVRRGRVVARQIYVFETGRRLGWRPRSANPVIHGCDYLFSRLHDGDGVFHTAVEAGSGRPRAPFSLYEHAFYLYALAQVNDTLAGRYPIGATAAACLGKLRRDRGRTRGGFEESDPPTLPLKSNPHMHLLEAALAWLATAGDAAREPWVCLAQEVVDLCLARFIDAPSGAVREYFDADWRPIAGDAGRLVEPGHQFEWAWLLLQWAASEHCPAVQRPACHAAAVALVNLAERHGVDPVRGVAFNELWDDLRPKDRDAKLWPQTERIKAWCAMLVHATVPAEAERARRHLTAAIHGLMQYFDAEPAGLWQEVLRADGRFTAEPCKASSFYHIVCAIQTVAGSLRTGPGSAVDR
jgi:mannose-6-phosphate isomerase